MPQTKPTLFVVATPIGNLGDVSRRAEETLRGADVICCEDTRVTAKLLSALGISVSLMALHEHSDERTLTRVVDMLREGKTVSYVSDAGTPGISDPGGKLVARVAREGFAVVPIPGPSAVIAALSVAGVPTERFTFLGFPPQKKGRLTFFTELAEREETLVLYESTHRIGKTLDALPPDRHLVVCRELTKLHETVYRGTSREVAAQLAATSSKGEFVIVLAPKGWKV